MARVGYIPFDQNREDEKAEWKAERRAMRKAPVEDSGDEGMARFEGLNPNDAEFDSVSEFAEFLLDSDEFEFDHRQLHCLNARTGTPIQAIKHALESIGFKLKPRAKVQHFRGFSSNSHNLYEGNPMCGGGGGASIYGMVD